MMRPFAILFSAIAVLAWGSVMSAEAQERAAERSVTVEARGVVYAEPDLVVISTGVATEAASARDALSRNTASAGKLIAGLKALGIAPADIQTSRLSLEPRYSQPKDGSAPTVTGYRVFNQVRITSRQVDKLGEVLDQAVTLGANQMGGIEFRVSKAEELMDEARRQAMANAMRRARLFAAGGGAELGNVISIREETRDAPRPLGGVRAMAAAPVPIEQGTQALEVSVSVTWQLK